MSGTHFVMTIKPDNVYFKGPFLQSRGNREADFFALRIESYGLRLLPVRLFNSLGCRSGELHVSESTWRSLERALWSQLNTWAAPGYEFTAWIIEGRKVWGWFPREG